MRPKGLLWLWTWSVYALIVAGAMAACAPYLERTVPTIVLDPERGGPGTSVFIGGSGFPAETQVSVRLGPPSVGASPQSYGDARTDASGSFTLLFTIPSHWPDGTPVTETNLIVVVLNEDGSARASAPFGYLPPETKPMEPLLGVAEVPRRLILAWHREGDTDGFCGDLLLYEGGYTEIAFCQGRASLARRQLPNDAVDQVHEWVADYASFEIEQIKGTGPSRVLTRTTFVGEGSRQISELELRMIQTLLETLVTS